MLFSSVLAIAFFSCLEPHNPQNEKSTVYRAVSDLSIRDTVKEIDKSIVVIYQDKNGNYWFGSNGQGVYRHDGLITVRLTTENGLCNNRIRDIQEDEEGHIFFTTWDGISRFDGNEFTTLIIVKGNKWKMEPGDLWFKGEQGKNGPYRYDGESLYHLEFPKHYLEDEFNSKYPNAAYSPYEVYNIYQDQKGHVWFGTSNFGLCRFDGQYLSWLYERHLTEIGDASFGIRSIIEDSDGYFWICNTRFRFKIYSGDSIVNSMRYIQYDKKEGASISNDQNHDDFPYFMSIVEDDLGELWMATYDRGVWRYNGKELIHYLVRDGSIDVNLFSIYKDHHGVLWLGTHDSGVFRYNGVDFEKFRL